MSWHFSRALVEAFSGGSYSGGEPSAPSNATDMPPMFYLHDKTMAPSRRSRSGMTCAPLTAEHGEAVLMSFQAAFRARISVRRTRTRRASTASEADCGVITSASFAMYDRHSCSWKTCQLSLLEGLDEYSGTWPRSGTMRSGVCSVQTISVPITIENACGSSPMLPTPTAGDAKASGSAGYSTSSGRHSGVTLTDAVVRFPTPRASDADRGACPSEASRNSPSLVVAAMFPTPRTKGLDGGSHARARLEEMGVPGLRGQLNPTWVEWLMGWPPGWTDCAPLAMVKFHEWQQQHSSSCAGEEVGR